MDYLLNSHKANHERPPLLAASIVELKIQLSAIAKEFKIEGDLDLDLGHMFSYRISALFPTHFAQQSLLLSFDPYDTSKESDYLNIERISKNIELHTNQEKVTMLNDIKRVVSRESKRSMLGKISAEDDRRRDIADCNKLERLARENNIGEAFFTLEEP
jgi:hypothetical protein